MIVFGEKTISFEKLCINQSHPMFWDFGLAFFDECYTKTTISILKSKTTTHHKEPYWEEEFWLLCWASVPGRTAS
jgi:hypothetical protein